MATINHLRNKENQRKVLTVAFGRHYAEGHLLWSYLNGNQVYCFNRLGEGRWNKIEAAWWRGVGLADSEYHFHPGAHSTGFNDSIQGVDTWFEKDVPHSHTATIGYRTPPDEMDASDLYNNPPVGIAVIAQTKWCPNFNASGVKTSDAYSVNPANEIIEILLSYARMPNVPSIWASVAAYWISRIDWANWVDFRDYHSQNELVDYTLIGDGAGLTAEYYEGQNFDTMKAKRIEPVISLEFKNGSPAYGVVVDNFSAKFRGKIKALYTETYTFKLYHDDGGILRINGVTVIDHWGDAGEHSGTINLVAGQFYDIEIDYYENTGNAGCILKWSSTSQTEEIVPQRVLFPKPELRPLYEVHTAFDTPISPGDAIRRILFLSNSIMQDVNGKLRFYCLEQLSPSFNFDSSRKYIEGTFNFKRRDILQSDPVTTYEAKFRDLDSQYLEDPIDTVSFKVDYLTRKVKENIKVVELYNTNRWQARKVLQARAKLEVGNNLTCEFQGLGATTYGVLPGDMVAMNHRKISSVPKNYLVIEATDKGVSESGRIQSNDVDKRTFRIQEWS